MTADRPSYAAAKARHAARHPAPTLRRLSPADEAAVAAARAVLAALPDPAEPAPPT